MPHPHPHPQMPPVSRRRLLEGGAAVLGVFALPASAAPTHAAERPGAANGTPEWNGAIDVFRVGTG
jgi:beta-galactosidase